MAETSKAQQVILASGNLGKLKEFSQAFVELGIELTPQPKTAVYEVEETGSTFVENAIIKARNASQLSGLPALADDSGLIVPALNGQPGVYSARYADVHGNDLDNLNFLLENMQGITDRAAHFFCCLVYMRHHQDPDPIIAKGLWHGQIAHQASGSGGFGYDPIFFIESQQCTAAELNKDIKQNTSHRAIAIKQLSPLLAAELKA